jgi:hypothetical protein
MSSLAESSSIPKQNTPLIVRSFFAPDSCLQGSNFPIHMIWNQDKSVKVNVYFPSNLLKLKEIYNVDKHGLKVEKDYLSITKLERNGYVGFVFEANIYEEPSITIPIKIEIETSEGLKQVISHETFLFRPNVIACVIPEKIKVSAKDNRVFIKNKIALKNEGKGTAIVKLELTEPSDVLVKMPEEIEGFVERFCSTLTNKSKSIKENFPQYAQIIDAFTALVIDSVKGSFQLTKEYARKMKDTLDELEKAFEKNEDFLKDVLEAILGAYISAVNIITEINSFFEYLKSLAENKVILLNASSVIELKPGLNKIFGRLSVQDLVRNMHEPVQVSSSVEVDADQPIEIPLYAVFEWLR